MSLENDLQSVIELARQAGSIVLDKYGKTRRLTKTHQAAHAEAVTEADRASQRHIVAGLRKLFPADGIVGEENDTGDDITFDCPDPAGRVWVIDPVDGTNNFVAGVPVFAVCIGLLEAGRPVLGVVYDVCRQTVYAAASGHGAWVDSRRVQAPQGPLDDSSVLMLTANLVNREGRLPGYVAKWMSQTIWKVRILGSAALEASLVGAGSAHGAVTVHGKIWDAAAAAAIVLEAGGRFTDLVGRDVFPFDLRGYSGAKVPFLAAGPAAHATLLDEIRGNP
jgi:myo-inositol-1(or 4)-monophosphatase